MAIKRWQVRALVETARLKSDRRPFHMLSDGNQWSGGWRFGDHEMDKYQARIEAIAATKITPAA
ncbi:MULTISPECIES: hypothetical protein [Burkholderia]|uniref:hypothetical protein n=1 Tax=Burkholderia TaxID=32008 RepID=UPI000841262C|nr:MULTISPECIES: hypothetical protein [unclassified Burkholderia]AOK32064.1 hypothetical protein AQ611_21550 [Burkholderia sp. Bp7605]